MPLVHCLVGKGIPITLKMYVEFRLSLLKMAAYFKMLVSVYGKVCLALRR